MDSPLGLWASSTLTSLVLPSGTQPKPFSHPCTINLFLPSLINKSLVFASYIFLQPLTPSTTTYYSKDCLPGSVLLTRLSTDSVLSFFPLFLRQNTENIIPIMPSHLWCSARFSSGAPTFHPLHYSTQLSHQSLLNRPSATR